MAGSHTWNGKVIVAQLREAAVGALDETLEAGVEMAQHYVHVESGNLQSRIRVIQPAEASGEGLAGQFGVDDVEYAAIQEFGPADGRPYSYSPYIRPAAEIEARRLGERIKKRMG